MNINTTTANLYFYCCHSSRNDGLVFKCFGVLYITFHQLAEPLLYWTILDVYLYVPAEYCSFSVRHYSTLCTVRYVQYVIYYSTVRYVQYVMCSTLSTTVLYVMYSKLCTVRYVQYVMYIRYVQDVMNSITARYVQYVMYSTLCTVLQYVMYSTLCTVRYVH